MAFLVFEGLDGSGKSTLIRTISQELDSRGIPYVLTREPGGTALGDELRQIILRRDGDTPVPECELLLYEAIRAQHVARVIKPALAAKKWVLCDRYTASTLAFQVGGRGLTPEPVEWLNNYATQGVTPTAFVLVDVPVEVGAARQAKRHKETGQDLDRFEIEKQDFHERVRKSYLMQARENPGKWLVLDGNRSPDEISEEFLRLLKDKKWLPS